MKIDRICKSSPDWFFKNFMSGTFNKDITLTAVKKEKFFFSGSWNTLYVLLFNIIIILALSSFFKLADIPLNEYFYSLLIVWNPLVSCLIHLVSIKSLTHVSFQHHNNYSFSLIANYACTLNYIIHYLRSVSQICSWHLDDRTLEDLH